MSNTGHYNTGAYNNGNNNTGNKNTGHLNTGSCNTGNGNTRHYNTGHYNTGDHNTGHSNTGHRNTGHYNNGSCNTGHCNNGNNNTGCYNTSDYHTGFFNTKLPEKVYCFNQPVDYYEFEDAVLPNWIQMVRPTTWILSECMTRKEKQDNPSYETTGGYLRENDLKLELRKAFEQATPEDIELTKKLPAFDPEVFLEITGIDLREDQPKKEIVIDGITYVRKDG